ncbi:hypothetical protein J4Q44_G00224150 [Coregonus suidteri]|uniref:Uncharacterized protein n=1 Tax=Coregonus suidteri TaxID=861788 RepID=A0AAN8QZC8_9TELE
MQKPLTATKHGLHKYQVQQHKGLLRSLELEHRYCMRGIEQQQRQYHRALGRLGPGCCPSSQRSRANTPCSSTLPALHGAQTGSRRMGSTRAQMATSVDGRSDTEEPQPDPRLALDYSAGVETNMIWTRAVVRQPTWATLTFADIRHRHMAMIQTMEPFRKWKHMILSSTDQSSTATRLKRRERDESGSEITERGGGKQKGDKKGFYFILSMTLVTGTLGERAPTNEWVAQRDV